MDYQDDCLFIGLKELYGSNVVDVNKRNHVYTSFSEQDAKNSYGKGMTVTRVLPDLNVDRTEITQKIKNKYFDLIVYGSIWRCSDYFYEVLENYSVDRIAVVDGEDHSLIHQSFKYGVKYFKRELYSNDNNILPISFALPTTKINFNKDKIKDFSFITPLDVSTYIYDSEEMYYRDYNESRFGVTTKKGGWDCLRHYEILGNGCIPIFIDIENCPNRTLINFPKKLCEEVKSLIEKNNKEAIYKDYIEQFETHFFQNNTTSALAKYFFNTIKFFYG